MNAKKCSFSSPSDIRWWWNLLGGRTENSSFQGVSEANLHTFLPRFSLGFPSENSTAYGKPLGCKDVTRSWEWHVLEKSWSGAFSYKLNQPSTQKAAFMNLEVPSRDDATSVKKLLNSIPLFSLNKKKSATSVQLRSSSPSGSTVVCDPSQFLVLCNWSTSQPYRIHRFPFHLSLMLTPRSSSPQGILLRHVPHRDQP